MSCLMETNSLGGPKSGKAHNLEDHYENDSLKEKHGFLILLLVMTWKEEFRLYWGGQLPTDAAELEALLDELGISAFNIAVTKFGTTGVDTNEVQKRIRDTLNYRWGSKIAVISAGVSIVGAILAWIAFFAK